MLLFGHAGITLGIVALASGFWQKGRSSVSISHNTEEHFRNPKPVTSEAVNQGNRVSWLNSMCSGVDIRLLLIGSLLPDIIDKPVGQFFLRNIFSNGRIFCHTLLFLILISLAGTYLRWRYGKTWLLTLSFGTLTHLILDEMWIEPQTLLWPFLGFVFEKKDLTFWAQNLLHAILTNPEIYVLELIGAGVLLWFALGLVRQKRIHDFLTNGHVLWFGKLSYVTRGFRMSLIRCFIS